MFYLKRDPADECIKVAQGRPGDLIVCDVTTGCLFYDFYTVFLLFIVYQMLSIPRVYVL